MAAGLLEGAREVARVLRQAGHEAYFAGGCVRDTLLGLSPKDYDVVTDAHPERVQEIFERTIEIGAAFGVVSVLLGRGRVYEVATYRKERGYSDGRRPDEVEYSTSKVEDVQRRDFTVNGMLMDPATGEVIDFVGGQDDLMQGILRAVGDPKERFAEDRLRMLRAVRFAARLGFSIDPATTEAIRDNAEQVGAVSVERIVGELHGMWGSERPGYGTRLLSETRLLGPVFPFIEAGDPDTVAMLQERFERLHEACRSIDETGRLVTAWAAVLDLARDADPERILRNFKLSQKIMRPVQRLLAKRTALATPDSLPVAERVRLAVDADASLCVSFVLVRSGLDSTVAAAWQAEQADLAARPLPARPLVRGRDLQALGLAPGPRFKSLLRSVEDAVFERRVATREEALDWLRAHLDRRDS